jgi:hypothetical protein
MGNFDKALDEDFQNQPVMPAIPPVKLTVVWDIGPQLPAPAPTKPNSTATPAAWLDYEEDVAHHVALVLQYRRQRAEWVQRHGGGPVKVETDAVSAREMVERSAGRMVFTLPAGLMLGG